MELIFTNPKYGEHIIRKITEYKVEGERRSVIVEFENSLSEEDIQKISRIKISDSELTTELLRPIILKEMDTIREFECKLFLKNGFCLEMKNKFPEAQVRIIPPKERIIIEGYEESINKIKLEIYERKERVKNKIIELSPNMKKFYEACSEYIENLLNELKIVYELKENQLILKAFSEDILNTTRELLKNEIIELSIEDEISDISESTLVEATRQLNLQIDKMYHPKRVLLSVIKHPKTELILISDSKIRDEVSDQVRNYLLKDLSVEKNFDNDFTQEELKFFKFVAHKEFDDLQSRYFKKKVILHLKEVNDKLVMNSNGNREAYKELKLCLRELLKKQIEHKIEFKELGDYEMCEIEEISHKIQKIQIENECVLITKIKEIRNSEISLTEDFKKNINKNSQDVKNMLNIEIGSILDDSKEYDCIILATNTKLELHNAPLANQILKKAGSVIQDELNKNYPKGINSNTIAISSGGSLKCVKYIIYVYVSDWNTANKEILKTQYLNILMRAFNEASRRSCKNIAFPAIGTGNLGYPREYVVEWIYQSVLKFNEENMSKKTIASLVLYEKDKETIEAFQNFRKHSNKDSETLKKDESILNLSMEIGSILDESKKYDCLIVPISKNLEFGPLGKIVLEKAGTSIQTELQKKYPNGIGQNKVVTSSGGSLPNIKCIVYVCINPWDSNDEQDLKNTYRNSINKALRDALLIDCKNIAIPALGSGNLNYPKNLVAKWLHEVLTDASKYLTNSRVSVVANEKDKEMIQELINFFPNDSKPTSFASRFFQKITNLVKTSPFINSLQVNEFSEIIGSIKVCVREGDITNSSEIVIVSPTDSKFSLDGGVANAIMQKGGQELKDLIINKPLLNGILWSPAPNLNCKEILHIDVRSDSINNTVSKVLKETDGRKILSVGLPVIGTGRLANTNYQDVTSQILSAVLKFSNKSNYVKNVTIYVDKKEILEHFRKAFETLKVTNSPILSVENQGASKKYLEVRIISNKQDSINKVRDQLAELLQMSYKKDGISLLASLNELELQEVKTIADKSNCKCVIDLDKNIVNFEGYHKNVDKCKELVTQFLLKVLAKQNEEIRSEELALKTKNIRWEYKCSNLKKWTPFSVFINQIIEKAYLEKKQEIKITNEYNEECLLSLEKQTLNNGTTVRRIDLNNQVVSIQIPNLWELNKLCDLIRLDVNSEEYKKTENIFKNNGMDKKYQRIISIDRIQNQALWVQYTAHKKRFEERDPQTVNERILFHGTTSESISSIWKMGFNRSYCGKNATMFGKGVYFALRSDYSDRYTQRANQQGKQMFISKVLIGLSALGNKDIETKNLPTTPQGLPVDSTVDNMNNPAIFVVYLDAQAYPEYLITYE